MALQITAHAVSSQVLVPSRLGKITPPHCRSEIDQMGVHDIIINPVLHCAGKTASCTIAIKRILRLYITVDIVVTLVAIGAAQLEMEFMEVPLPIIVGRYIDLNPADEVCPLLFAGLINPASHVRIKGLPVMALETEVELIPESGRFPIPDIIPACIHDICVIPCPQYPGIT